MMSLMVTEAWLLSTGCFSMVVIFKTGSSERLLLLSNFEGETTNERVRGCVRETGENDERLGGG